MLFWNLNLIFFSEENKTEKVVNADAMVTLDGDGQHDPNQIPLLLDALHNHNVDVVIGSRSLDYDNTPSYRKAGIKIITSATNYSTNIKVSDS